MIEIVFLGTSASAPSIHRGLSAQVVLYRDYRFLVDCGEGTQRQILYSGLGFKRLNRILLTHGHLDHILGLGGLISTFARWETVGHIEIYGGSWALERVYDLIYGVALRGAEPSIKIDLIEVRPGVVLEDDTFEVVAFPVAHRGPCLGYLFREKPRRPFLNERAEALGVPQGPERRRLVAGASVTLADGRAIHPDDVLGPPRLGACLAHVGDAGRTENLKRAVRGADLMSFRQHFLLTSRPANVSNLSKSRYSTTQKGEKEKWQRKRRRKQHRRRRKQSFSEFPNVTEPSGKLQLWQWGCRCQK